MIFLVIVVVAGIVAMWNRSRYHPSTTMRLILGLPACQTDNRRVLAVLRYLGS
jgi:hypothetical protein